MPLPLIALFVMGTPVALTFTRLICENPISDP
jgi:sorbitol-specific phosphotransferase system component IIC